MEYIVFSSIQGRIQVGLRGGGEFQLVELMYIKYEFGGTYLQQHTLNCGQIFYKHAYTHLLFKQLLDLPLVPFEKFDNFVPVREFFLLLAMYLKTTKM